MDPLASDYRKVELVRHFRAAYADDPSPEMRRRLFDAESRAIAAGLTVRRTVPSP